MNLRVEFCNSHAPEAIAEVVFEATDQKDQLRYQAGPDAIAIYAQRLTAGAEAFRQGIAAQFA